MENPEIEARTNVKFLSKLGWKPAAILEALKEVYGDNAPPNPTVYRWIQEFKEGRQSVEDQPRSGRPTTSQTADHVAVVQQVIERDRRATIDAIAEEVGISHGSVHSILTDTLGLSKLSARWVPRLLRPEHRMQRTECAINLLNQLDADPDDFYQRLVTGDETWIFQYDPESKLQSKEWLPRGSRGPKKFRADRSAAKVLATVFWDSEGVVMVDFLEDQRTINATYYESLLLKLRAELARKRPGKLHRRILFHHDNAPAHTSRLCRDALREFRWEILQHPPYSPDLAPSDFFLFPKMKEAIKGVRHVTKETAKKTAMGWLAAQPPEFYRNGLERWRYRMEKCLTMEGDYVEK